MVAPARERGLKYLQKSNNKKRLTSRSRKGAWIEITLTAEKCSRLAVAPARERGLKYIISSNIYTVEYVAPARERGLK